MAQVYYKDSNNEIHVFSSIKAYKRLGIKLNLTKITNAERNEILNPPKTKEQRINEIERLIVSILETEMKDTKYFMGFGFKYGRNSVSRYPTNAEAIKLTSWQESVWTKAAVWFDAVNSGIESIDILTDRYIKENLPKIEDF